MFSLFVTAVSTEIVTECYKVSSLNTKCLSLLINVSHYKLPTSVVYVKDSFRDEQPATFFPSKMRSKEDLKFPRNIFIAVIF